MNKGDLVKTVDTGLPFSLGTGLVIDSIQAQRVNTKDLTVLWAGGHVTQFWADRTLIEVVRTHEETKNEVRR